MPFAHRTDRELERHFVVVHWDQRGSGKSNTRDFDPSTMHLDRDVEDAVELIRHLQGRLGQERVLLVGHSWGARIGIEWVHRHPEHFRGYVAIGQAVNHERATELARDWLLEVNDDYGASIPSLAVPVTFMHGVRDFNPLLELAAAYHDRLDAPSKELIVFEGSAHTPFFAEPEKFVSRWFVWREAFPEVARRHSPAPSQGRKGAMLARPAKY